MTTENANNYWIMRAHQRRDVLRTKKGHIHTGEEVLLPLTRVVIKGPVYRDGKLAGYRVRSGDGWYYTVPVRQVEAYVAG